jgi:enediyne biosynthesis protein E4
VRHLVPVAFAAFTLQATAQTDAPIPPIPRFIEETESSGFNSRFEGEAEYLVGGGVAFEAAVEA